MLPYSHARLDYVYHIVAELFTFLDNVHVHGAHGIGVQVVVDIIDVLTAQLAAIVVYLVLDIE